MVSPAMLIVALVIAIAIILFCIIVLKLNASIGMVLASLFMGVAGGLDLMTTMDTISSGFGSMMTSIGLPVGFGTILGQLMSDSGAADIIADKLVSAFPEKRSIWGLSLAGFGLSIPVFFDVTFIILIPIGIAMEIPEGYVGLVFARSGLASRRDLAPANKVGVVDSDYRGEFFVPMRNHGAQPQTIEPGERIAQFILTPYLTAQFFETETLTDTARGEGGFGSTGAK